MRILVTGGAGYVGSHTVRALLEAGHEPVVIDDLSKGHAEAVPPEVPFEKGDLADKQNLSDVFARYRPHAVMHFAGSSLVGESMRHPDVYFRNNLCNGLQLLTCMVEHGVDNIVFSSSAAVYGEPEITPIPEEHPKQPTNPYGESKLFFERMLARFEQAYNLRPVSLRYFNAAGAHPSGLIGEDHSPETHLIPIVLQTALGQREELAIFGADYPTHDGTCVRDYVHVSDLATAHVLALRALDAGECPRAINLGNGQGFSVQEVVSVAERVVRKPIPTRLAERRPGDPAVLVASAQRAQDVLGWQPKYTQIEEIIASAWFWHQHHPQGFATRRQDNRA